MRIQLLLSLLAAGVLSATVIEEDFKNYADFDPAHRNWEFRGVGGEVHGGVYRFNGVSIHQKDESDVHPALTMGQLRDFPAGPKVAAEADFELGRKGFSFLNPAEKLERRLGLVILDRQFSRAKRDPMTIPAILLTLDRDAAGKPSVFFGYTGDPKLTPAKTERMPAATWQPDGSYRLTLSLADGVATGIVKDNAGKVVYQAELRDPAFAKIFPAAHPGFVNQRLEGALLRFRADNLDSFKAASLTAPLPRVESWQLFIGEEKTARSIQSDGQGLIDVSKLAGGHGNGRSARLEGEVEVAAAGTYVAMVRGDWFWKLAVNGQTAADFSQKGNGSGDHVLEFRLNAGKNRLTVTLGSGSGGWNFRLAPPSSEALKLKEAARHLYGADRVLWNFDRLADDLNNLRRWKIEMPELEKELIAQRRDLPAGLTNRESAKYDTALDRFYLGVYNAWRLVRLRDLRSEIAGTGKLLGHNEETTLRELDRLDAALLAAVRKEDAASAEKLATEAQRLIDAAQTRFDGYHEGVTLGGNFGRFGWMTGDKVGAYGSGDGLLANQVLSNGALLRQYVTGADGKTPWKLAFRFHGNRDEAKAAALAALPTAGENREVEFGYDPSSFYSGNTPKAVRVHEINWIHKRFSYGNGFTADMNLASPSLLLESGFDTLELDDPSTSPLTHLGYRNANGEIVSLPLADGLLYDAKRDGKLGKNWVLLWSDRNSETDLARHRGSVPLQVVFQYQPERIERQGGKVILKLGKSGALWLNTPFGARLQPAGNWLGNLPPTAAGRCDLHGAAALAWPVEVREYFRAAGEGRMELVNHAGFRKFADNDWKIEPVEFVPVPPVLSLMMERGFDAGLPENLVDLGYPTIYGPLWAAAGNQLRYTLPIPDAPRTAFPKNPEANPADAAELVKWNISRTDGTRFRFYCENMARSWHTLTPALDHPVKAWAWLPGDYRDYLKGLYHFDIPFLSNFRDYRFWRFLSEPYSGVKYFYSFSIACRAPGDLGVFGDRGYGVGNHFTMLDFISSHSGEYEAVRQIWRDPAPLAPPTAVRDGRIVTVDKMQGYLTGVHDWAWMEAGSNDAGDNGPVVDCGQAVFGGVAALYRMARNLGNTAERDRAAYHLAKSQLSQIGRPAYRDYGHSTGTLGPDNINVGFRESITPNSYADSPMIGKSTRNEYDGTLDSLICYAYQDWLDIFYPYAKYVWNDLRFYEDERTLYWPNRDRGKSDMQGHLYSRLIYRMMDGMPQTEAVKVLRHWTKDAIFYLRSGALCEILPFALTGGCPLTMNEWYPVAAPEFVFTPSKRIAELRFRNVPESYGFRAASSFEPAVIRANGEMLPRDRWSYAAESYDLRVSLPAGETVEVEVEYARIDPDRFRVMPIPPAPKRIPAAPGLDPVDFTPASGKPPVATTTAAAKPAEQQLFRADFAGEAVPNAKFAGRWSFNTWSKTPLPVSGGLTGDYPKEGVPAQALEVKAVERDYAGRVSPRIPLTGAFKELVLRGEVTYGKDFANNRAIAFFWSGKSAHFFHLPVGKPGEVRRFEFILPAGQLPAGTEMVILQLACQFEQKSTATPAGSVFFREITVSAR